MANQPYFPRIEAQQVLWLNNYTNKLPTHGPTVDITAPEISETLQDIAHAKSILENWYPTIQQDAQEATAYKRLILDSPADTAGVVPFPVATVFASLPTERPPGGLKRLFAQIARLKTHPSYTPAMGEDLQIIGQEDAAVHLTPEFKLKVTAGSGQQMVEIKFTKFGHGGVYIESRRNAGAWGFLTIDTNSPYDDETPLLVANTAETREYRMRFWDAGDANGDWTAVQKVTVGA